MYRASRGLYRSLLLPLLRFRAQGTEHIPPSGGVILASNHQSYLDPIVVGCASPRVPVHFMARESLFRSRILAFYFRHTHTFGVRRGGADREAWGHFESLVRSGETVSFFPEGTRSVDGRLGRAHPGSGMLIHRCAGATVIPTRIRGTYRVLNRDRGLVGLGPVSIAFGPPVDLSAHWARPGGREIYQDLADKVMEAVAAVPAIRDRDDDREALTR